jgi:hypothetical protein
METENPKTETEKNNPTPKAPTLHTYKTDVAEYIKKEGKTMADIAIAESQRQTNVLREEEVEKNNFKISKKIVLIILGLVVLGGLAIFISFALKPKPYEELPKTANRKEIFVSSVTEKTIFLSNKEKEDALDGVSTALKEVDPFLVLNITAGKEKSPSLLTSGQFLEKLDIYPPGDLIRSMRDEYAIGSVGGQARFLVLKTNYYSGAFAGMFSWEKTMEKDLKKLLDLKPAQEAKIGSSTSPTDIKTKAFFDGIIMNRDARILRDAIGNVVLIYVLPDNETVVIAGSESTAKIVIDKLLRSKKE